MQEWGVDFLKYDWCHNNGANAREAYFTMCDALKSTGRPIVLSICEWGTNRPWEWGKGIGEMWRVSEDIIATTEGTAYWGGAEHSENYRYYGSSLAIRGTRTLE